MLLVLPIPTLIRPNWPAWVTKTLEWPPQERVSRVGRSSAVSSSSSCIVTSVDMVPPWGRSPPGQAARGIYLPGHPVAPGHGPDVRYLPNVLYVHHRTAFMPGQSMPASPDRSRGITTGLLRGRRARLVAMTTQATGDEQNPAAEQPGPAAALEPALNPLQRLIQQRMRERGWSYGEVARRGGLPRSTVYTLAQTRNLTRPPRPVTIDALARGLDVPVSAVRAAAAESTGLHYYDETPAGRHDPGDRERELLIASIDELTPEDRRHVAALVESLRKKTSPPPDEHLTPAPWTARMPAAAGRHAHPGPPGQARSVRPGLPRAGTSASPPSANPSAGRRAPRDGRPAPGKDPVPLENRIRLVTGRCSVPQAACVYSLIRPLRIGFRRICCVSMSVTVARGPSRSSSGTCCAMPW